MRRRSTFAGWTTLAVVGLTGSLLTSAATPAQAASVPGTGPGSATPTTSTALYAASVPTLSRTDQRVSDLLAVRSTSPRLGTDLTAAVTDAESAQQVWAKRRSSRQLPASTTKLVTAVNALETFGPAYRIKTTVRKGTTWGRVVLVGAGDPGLSRAMMNELAAETAAAVRARGVRRVTVQVDDSLFPRPTLAYGWKSSYQPTDVSPVRALVVSQHRRWDTSIDAGNVFSDLLARHGVRTRDVVRAKAPSGSPVLASVTGRRMDSLVRSMLLPSDNDYAEALHRLVALKTGHRPTWAGASAAQRAVLARLGVDLGTSRLYDGSGLSRQDRLTAGQLVRILSLAVDGKHPRLVSLPSSLPVAGRSGTLGANYLRYTTSPTRCAVGLVQAKTGSLSGVITLAGYARGADGRSKAFAFLANGVPSTLTTRRAVDKLAATVTGCW